MTNKEVVQALRYCKFGVSCENCPAVGNEDCFDEVNTAAADLIERLTAENAALREKQRWIPVTERMPEPETDVLAVCNRNGYIGEFLCDEIIEDRTYGHNEEFYRAACMSAYDAAAYAMQSPMYGWHISDLRVYDHPRDLWEFTGLRITKDGFELSLITRQPQSWRYVEEDT